MARRKERYRRADNLSQRQVSLFAVDGIRQVVAVFGALAVGCLNENHLRDVGISGCRYPGKFLHAVHHSISAFFGEAVEVDFLVVFLTLRVMEAGAAEEVEAALAQLLTYLVVHAAFLHMAVESSRRGMVDGDGCHNADTPSLRLQFLGNRREACAVRSETQHAVLGLCARRETGAGRRRVGDAVRSRMTGSAARIGESAHQRLHAPQRLTLQRRTVHLGTEHLVASHAVTDEIEHIFNFRACGERYY